MYSLKENKFKVLIVETFVADHLLQEGYELNCVVLIRLWQVDIFQIDDEPLAVSWSEYFAVGPCRLRAHLLQLLYHMEG